MHIHLHHLHDHCPPGYTPDDPVHYKGWLPDWMTAENCAVWFLLWKCIYVLVLTSVLPVNEIPVISECGTQTLAAYLVCMHSNTAIGWVSNQTWAWTDDRVAQYAALYIASFVALVGATSRVFNFAVWPVVTPTWLSQYVLEKPLPLPDKWAVGWGWLALLVAFVVIFVVLVVSPGAGFAILLWLCACSAVVLAVCPQVTP